MELKLLAVREGIGEQILNPDDTFRLLENESQADRECLWVLHLNSRLELIEKELVSMGNLNATLAEPREIFKKAILNSSANIIIAHNHPSGNCSPSKLDRSLCKRLVACAEILSIAVNDFIILGKRKYYSFAKEGLLQEYMRNAEEISAVITSL